MSFDYKNDGDFHEKLIEEVLSAYPDKFAKRRRKHLSVAKPAKDATEEAEGGGAVTECDVKSNIKSIPGVMTVRGCAYAGSKGVVWGPVKDMVHISHGRSAATITPERPASTRSSRCSSPPTSRSATSYSAATRSLRKSSTRSRPCFR
jgi:hypothetical protein